MPVNVCVCVSVWVSVICIETTFWLAGFRFQSATFARIWINVAAVAAIVVAVAAVLVVVVVADGALCTFVSYLTAAATSWRHCCQLHALAASAGAATNGSTYLRSTSTSTTFSAASSAASSTATTTAPTYTSVSLKVHFRALGINQANSLKENKIKASENQQYNACIKGY